jgi:hypothetical protein
MYGSLKVVCKSRIGVRLAKVATVRKPCLAGAAISVDGCLLQTPRRGKQELIACFALIRHGPHRKRRFQKFFVAAGTSLQSCYLAMIGGYTDRPTDTRVQQLFYCCVYSLMRERVYRAFT